MSVPHVEGGSSATVDPELFREIMAVPLMYCQRVYAPWGG